MFGMYEEYKECGDRGGESERMYPYMCQRRTELLIQAEYNRNGFISGHSELRRKSEGHEEKKTGDKSSVCEKNYSLLVAKRIKKKRKSDHMITGLCAASCAESIVKGDDKEKNV
jgi:hypothetical protein